MVFRKFSTGVLPDVFEGELVNLNESSFRYPANAFENLDFLLGADIPHFGLLHTGAPRMIGLGLAIF